MGQKNRLKIIQASTPNKYSSKEIIGMALGIWVIGNVRGGQQVPERGNLKGSLREIKGIALGIHGIGNLRGGQQASEGISKEIEGKSQE